MRPRYVAIVINAAVLLWLFHESISAYVHYFTDPEWLAYGVATHFQPLYAIRWVALSAALTSLFIRRPWAILLLVTSHLVLVCGPIGGAIGLSRVIAWSEIPADVLTGWSVAVLLSVLALLPLAFPKVRRDLAGARVAA